MGPPSTINPLLSTLPNQTPFTSRQRLCHLKGGVCFLPVWLWEGDHPSTPPPWPPPGPQPAHSCLVPHWGASDSAGAGVWAAESCAVTSSASSSACLPCCLRGNWTCSAHEDRARDHSVGHPKVKSPVLRHGLSPTQFPHSTPKCCPGSQKLSSSWKEARHTPYLLSPRLWASWDPHPQHQSRLQVSDPHGLFLSLSSLIKRKI